MTGEANTQAHWLPIIENAMGRQTDPAIARSVATAVSMEVEFTVAPDIDRAARIDTLKKVLARSRNGATGRALLLWVAEQLDELEGRRDG